MTLEDDISHAYINGIRRRRETISSKEIVDEMERLGRARPPNAPQLFILTKELVKTLDQTTVAATVKDLKELDLYRLPYPTVDIQVPASAILRVRKDLEQNEKTKFDDAYWVTFYGIGGPAPRALLWWANHPKHPRFDLAPLLLESHKVYPTIQDALIVVLATRNALKETKHRKSVKLGIGKSCHHEYTTTISLPAAEDMELEAGTATGREVCPHLRRGHIRRQRFGPKFSYVKSIWIEPVFVNADKEWVQRTRVAYNISIGEFPK